MGPKMIAKKIPLPYVLLMPRPTAFSEREESPAIYPALDSVLGICVPIACGILLSVFVLLVNQ